MHAWLLSPPTHYPAPTRGALHLHKAAVRVITEFPYRLNFPVDKHVKNHNTDFSSQCCFLFPTLMSFYCLKLDTYCRFLHLLLHPDRSQAAGTALCSSVVDMRVALSKAQCDENVNKISQCKSVSPPILPKHNLYIVTTKRESNCKYIVFAELC